MYKKASLVLLAVILCLTTTGRANAFYDPEQGRFITQDTYLGEPSNPPSLHRYLYAYSNPTTFVDPTGNYVESPWDIASLGIGSASLMYNLATKAWGDAALDFLGVLADSAALALPGVPGGAGVAIKAGRLSRAGTKAVEAVNSSKAIKYVSEAVQSSEALQEGIVAVRAADSLANAVQGVEAGVEAVEDIGQGKYAEGLVEAGAAALQAGHLVTRAMGGTRSGITCESRSGGDFEVSEGIIEVAAARVPESSKRAFAPGEIMRNGQVAGAGPGAALRNGQEFSGVEKAGEGVAAKSGASSLTREGYGVNDPAVRVQGKWTEADYKAALQGKPPTGLGAPDVHHADQMPGSAIHEVLPAEHRGNAALHPNKYNQGVTREMRMQDRQLHWWYRARELGADQLFPDLIYD